jgi:hypothetical protein
VARDVRAAAAVDERLAEALDRDRLDAVAEALTLTSKFAGAAALAAEAGDLITLAVRTRQAIATVHEAAAIIGTVGRPEACP